MGHDSQAAICSPCLHVGLSFVPRPRYATLTLEKLGSGWVRRRCNRPTPNREPKHVMPGPTRGCLSLFSLHWMTGLMWKAHRGTISTDDVWHLRVSWLAAGECR